MLAHWYQLLLRSAAIELKPENGPSGGPNWTRGYKAPFDYNQPQKIRSKRDELLFLTA